ncbi:MAG: hypothetical protein FWF57_00655 [Defluviitaleaceae bacterium]|nr:hypothetical protein [Defluviitaleaceae bacterium]
MIFADSRYFRIKSSSFLGNRKISYGDLDGVLNQGKITPLNSCGIDIDKQLAVIKMFNEHCERFLMDDAINTQVKSIDHINKTIKLANKFDFSYNESVGYGIKDTTGTAAGYDSSKIIQKAVQELLEKNEMLLLWYKNKGKLIEKNNKIQKHINKFDFKSSYLDIFLCNELSNFYTIITIVYTDTRIISSGIGVSYNFDVALKLSLEEAYMLECGSLYYPLFSLNFVDEDTHQKAVNHVLYLKKNIETFKDSPDSPNNLKIDFVINENIKNLNIQVLNKGFGKRSTTIKCISTDLCNSLPTKNKIKTLIKNSCGNNWIVSNYELEKLDFENIADCILV